MNTDFKAKKNWETQGWFTYTLSKLDLADISDIDPAMLTKIRIREIESKMVINMKSASKKLMRDLEYDLYWNDHERESEKKS